MGIFQKNSDGVWWVRYTDGNGKLHREKIGPRSLAQKVYHMRKAAVLEQRFFPKLPRDLSIEEALDAFMESKRDVYRDVAKYQSVLRSLKAGFAGKTLRSITVEDVRKFAALRRATCAPATVNRGLAVLKTVYNQAIADGRAEINPVKSVKLFQENNQRVRFLTADEEQKLHEVLPFDYWALVVVALHSGMRQSEQFDLCWTDVNFETGVITIPRSKNGSSRTIVMNDTLRDTLRALPSWNRGELVFPNSRDTRLNASNFLNKAWIPALKRAGVENFRWHDLRHTFASRLVMAGVDLRTVQELMGHKTMNMTLRYAHLSPEHNLAAVKKLDEYCREVVGQF